MERYIDIIPKASSKTLLIVDDDEASRNILASLFSDEYSIKEAENDRIGLNKISAVPHRYCAILLDVMMPAMNGLEVLQHLKQAELLDKIPVFLITVETNDNVMKEAYRLGVMGVISKPITPYVVARRVNSVVKLFRIRHRLSSQVMHQQEELLERAGHIVKLGQGMIEALSTAIELRSVESRDYVRRIYKITKYISEYMELGIDIDATSIEQIVLASIMYDVGKIATPDVVLNKPGRLMPEEFEIMKIHTIQGALSLEKVPQLRENDVYRYAYDIARHHHERWDGSGYPDRLKGNEISLWAQAVLLVDVYDALSCERVYEDAYLCIQVLEMIQSGVCGVFNPHLLECFFSVEGTLSRSYRH